MQQILVTNGSVTFAILNVFQADSVHMSSSGYYDAQCDKHKKFHSHTEEQFQNHLDDINPIVVKLIGKDCVFPEGGYDFKSMFALDYLIVPFYDGVKSGTSH